MLDQITKPPAEKAVAPPDEPMVPRMTQAELALFTATLANKQAYLEFGCGGSTLVALNSGLKRIVSVESDPSWIRKLRGRQDIHEAEASKRLAFCHADIGAVGDWGAPREDKSFREWPKYYTDVWLRHDSSYEAILIDGRFRVACALMSAIFAPEDCAVIVHDYNNRLNYSAIEKYFDVIDTVDTMALLRKRRRINMRALVLELVFAALDAK